MSAMSADGSGADRSLFLASAAPPRPVTHGWQRLGRARLAAAWGSDRALTTADATRSTVSV